MGKSREIPAFAGEAVEGWRPTWWGFRGDVIMC